MLLTEGVGSPEATCEVMAVPTEERVNIGTSGMNRLRSSPVEPRNQCVPVEHGAQRLLTPKVTQTIPKSHSKSLYRIHDTSLGLTTSMCGFCNVAIYETEHHSNCSC